MKRLSTLALLTAVVATLLGGATASAAPATWTVNNHTYDVIDGQITWTAAKAAAEGLGGHLATINSGDEDKFIYDTFGGPAIEFHWLGGSQSFTATAFDAGWSWVVPSEPFSFTHWNSPPEPNDGNDGVENGTENYLHYFSQFATDVNGVRWNDAPDSLQPGFIIEYEPTGNGVPEPSSLALLGVAFGGLVARSIRKRSASHRV